ncbi:MAG: ABC transporter ATP-binding protein [Longicatena sp.]
MNSAIQLKNIKKEYKNFKMDTINLEIPKGLATVLIGNNGAGKTTLLKIISGLITYEGSIEYKNKIAEIDGDSFKESMVYVPDTCCFGSFMDIARINEIMKLGFHKYSEVEFKKLCKDFEITTDQTINDKKVGKMSTGNKMKLMLCALLARDGEYLLLDEPAANLDPVMQDILQEKMRKYLENEEHTIIYSTHNIEQVHNVADYAIFMCDGKVIEKGYIDDLCEMYCVVKGNLNEEAFLRANLDYIQVNKEVVEGFGKCESINKWKAQHEITIEKPNLRDLSLFLLKKGHHHA